MAESPATNRRDRARSGDGGLPVGEARELAALRERAYGPRPDLDAVGEERLRVLERRVREAAPTSAAPAPTSAAPVAATTAPPPASAGPMPEPPAAPPAAASPPRRHPVLVALGALAAGVALVAVGYTFGRMPSPGDPAADDTFLAAVTTDPSRAETLTAAAPFSSRTLDPATLVQYEPLGGATFWSAAASDGTRCLLLTVPVDGAELSAQGGVFQTSCTPGGLPPSIQWTAIVGYPSPPDVPLGSVVRVTVDGDRLRLATGRAS